jgi:hypothetical protein
MTTQPPSRDLFIEIGQALYGHQWQNDMARALDVGPRTLRYWVSGGRPLPEGIYGELADLMADRIHDLDTLLGRILGDTP